MNTEWIDIPGYEGKYRICRDGRIMSFHKHRKPFVMKQWKRRDGYWGIILTLNGSPRNYAVHRILAKMFVEKKSPHAIEVNHIDGNKENNHVSNLEWVTRSENKRHAVRLGLLKPPRLARDKSPRAILSQKQVDAIRKICHMVSVTDLAAVCGVSRTAIQLIKSGKNWQMPEVTV